MISDVSIIAPAVSSLPKAEQGLHGRTDHKFNVDDQKGAGSSSQYQQVGDLTEEEKAQVEELKKTDQEVRAHEQAHKNVGGQYAGSISYTYTSGPDGKRYAVGGEVPIDTAPVEGDPEATIAKMDVVIAAALAPAEPSAQDRKVAATAVAARNKARADLAAKKKEEQEEEQGLKTEFDINDFGKIPDQSAYNAYKTGLELNQTQNTDGQNFNIRS